MNSLFDGPFLPWALIVGSSLASILGATVVFADAVIRKFTLNPTFSLANNKNLISSILALSSGILFYSSQFLLLPEALEQIETAPLFQNHPYIFFGLFYSLGIAFIFILNKIVAVIAPSAIACPCNHFEDHNEDQILVPEPNVEHAHDHSSHTPFAKRISSPSVLVQREASSRYDERASLLPKSRPTSINFGLSGSTKRANTINGNSSAIYSKFFSDAGSECECKFTPTASVRLDQIWGDIPIKDLRRFSHLSCSSPSENPSFIATNEPPSVLPIIKARDVEQRNLMWSVGIQTAVAVGLHKLPEGIITVIGAESSEKLGISLFIGIACHNFPEGFMLAVPIYAATGSALKSFAFATLIGGFTQPLGGLIGLALLDRVNHSKLATLNSVTFSLVSGIMLSVIFQSFVPAIRRHHSDSNLAFPIFWFLAGSVIMATLTFLFGHI